MTAPAPSGREQVSGAQSLITSLEAAGVTDIFGIPGGAILPAYDPLKDSTRIRHILVRHEQGAGHAAQGHPARTARRRSRLAPRLAARPPWPPPPPSGPRRVRHERGPGHAAQGYPAATGRVGVCMATSGP